MSDNRIALVLLLFSCVGICCRSPYPGLKKLSYKALYQRARDVVVDPAVITYKDAHGRDLPLEAVNKLNRDSFAADSYVDQSDTVRLRVVRKIKAKDIRLRQNIKQLYDENADLKIRRIRATVQDTALQRNMIELAYYNMPIKPVPVRCDSIQYLLEHLLQADQNNRNPQTSQWQIDRANQIQVVSIIENCGFPDNSTVGDEGMYALFMVIQHGQPQLREQYYPTLRKKAEKDLFDKSLLALMEDRILTEQGKKQKFGTQVEMSPDGTSYELYPMEDPAHVDKRRAVVGLGPISEYLQHFGIDWDEYLKTHADLQIGRKF
jgi:hypothetical protein